MNKKTFDKLWQSAYEWYENEEIQSVYPVDAVPSRIFVKDLCSLKENYSSDILLRYNRIKKETKNAFFSDPRADILNRFKRAAVLVYAINSLSPLNYSPIHDGYMKSIGESSTDQGKPLEIDCFFLKQRLAFYIGLCSILQDYDSEEVKKLNPVFIFPKVVYLVDSNGIGSDTFLTSVYKDLFYAEIYSNYNVLTMANLFWMITEFSNLRNIKPLS